VSRARQGANPLHYWMQQLPSGFPLSPAHRDYDEPMHLFENMACAFFRTFGITQPDNQTRRRAAWFILALLVVAFCGVSTVGAVVYHWMHS
jgi:hypothetical protein